MTVRTLPRAPAPEKGAERPRKTLRGRLWKRVSREVRQLVPAWLFFFLSFSLLRLTQTAVLEEFGVDVIPPSHVLAGSLIVAKALMTVDALRIFRRLEDRPIIVVALIKTVIYGIVVFFFEYSETLFEFRGEGISRGSLEFAHRMESLRFWVIQVWLVILLFVYSTLRGFAHRLGRGRFRRLLIGR